MKITRKIKTFKKENAYFLFPSILIYYSRDKRSLQIDFVWVIWQTGLTFAFDEKNK